MHHRMVTLRACGFAITACYALGLGVQALDVTGLRAPLIALLALVVLMAVRYYRLPPPGPVFFVMAAAIGASTPVPFELLPSLVGLLVLGVLGATLISLCYSLRLHARRTRAPGPGSPLAR